MQFNDNFYGFAEIYSVQMTAKLGGYPRCELPGDLGNEIFAKLSYLFSF